MNIPIQLKGLRLCKVGEKSKVINDKEKLKAPFESSWQNNPHTYQEASNWMNSDTSDCHNYGIICGQDIRVLDDDTPKKGLIKLYHDNFPETMEVRDHIYFKFDNAHADKIIFESKVLLFSDSKGKMSAHMGELQGEGTMVVGAGSKHPSGEIYKLKKDLPISTISFEKFKKIFGEYFKEKKQKIIRNHKPSNWEGDKITDIPIGNIISFDGLRDVGCNCLQGEHPKHGSDNGMNFRVDVKENTWICFRCNNKDSRGCGGPSELIAVMEGILDCGDVGANCYTDDVAREVIKVAREKYGLSTPEPTQQDLGEVKGWANSVSIIKLAKKHKFENCHICNNPFKFENKHGMYYCKHCKFGGGLNKFAELISKRINQDD